ncbi:MAG TPA: hypothetical protein VL285_11310, partial [Bryobacteraceae bacterium]|nr:hypothetical protein [Bryobacteraceae bacterium]
MMVTLVMIPFAKRGVEIELAEKARSSAAIAFMTAPDFRLQHGQSPKLRSGMEERESGAALGGMKVVESEPGSQPKPVIALMLFLQA